MNATISTPSFSTTLSVNPVTDTLGTLHPELQATIIRSGRAIARNTRRAAGLLPLVFAVKASRPVSVLLLFTRLLFGAMFMVMGLSSLGLIPLPSAFDLPQWGAWMEIAGGAALILGLFSRISMLILTGLFAWLAYEGVIAGFFPQTALLCTLCTLFSCIAGPGRYSIDTPLYRALSKN